MRVSELVKASKAAKFAQQTGDPEVLRPIADSRHVKLPGDLFFCMPSSRTDTHALISAAREAGATSAVLHSQAGIEHAVLLTLYLPRRRRVWI